MAQTIPIRVPPSQPIQREGFYALRWRRFRRNRFAYAGFLVLVLLYLACGLGPYVYRKSPYEVNPAQRLASPRVSNLLGTDDVGRDILARVIYGGRVSLTVGLVAMGIALGIGTLAGSLSGYFEGWVDSGLMRLTDAMLALPTFFFVLAVLSLFGGGAAMVVMVIGITSWMRAARVVRGEFLRWKVQEFVLAARALGASDKRIIAHHLMPQALSSILVEATLGVAYAILTESALSFLGLGIRLPTPTWGNMLFNAQSYIWMAPQLAVWPGWMILITVLSFNSFGDGLRDALDPRTR